MRCPKCGYPYFKTTNVINNSVEPNDTIHRDRRCDSCGFIWTTIETILDPSGETRTNTDPKGNILEWSANSLSEFREHKRKAMKAAKELCYGQSVVDHIQEATNTVEIDQIMKAARKRSLA